MPIKTPDFIEMQKAGRQLGELRFGTTADLPGGKKRPVKLETWRFTTDSPRLAMKVAEYFGEEAKRVELANHTETFEVMTKVDSLKVIIPPGERAIDQWFRMYSGGGCQRRCDGETEQISQKPCMCPADPVARNEAAKKGKACKPTTQARVMLPYIDGLGVWRVASTGFHAAVELGGDTMRLAEAQARGMNLPAVLWLNKRKEIKDGQTREYMVPCLDVEMPLEQIVAIAAGGGPSLRSVLGVSSPPETPRALQAQSGGTTGAMPPSSARTTLRSVPTPGGDDDEILEAELVDDGSPVDTGAVRAETNSSAQTTRVVQGQSQPNDETPGALRAETQNSGGTTPASPGGDAAATQEELSSLQIKRSQVGLVGGPWAKFAAQVTGRGVAVNETQFTQREVAVLQDALDSYKPGQ